MDNSRHLSEVDNTKLQAIESQWFAPHRRIGINTTGGNELTEGKFLLGLIAGPNADLFNLFHEMSHFIEIDNRRCHLSGWGLTYGKSVNIGGRSFPEGMVTNQAIEREIRTFGIQVHFHNQYGWSNQRYSEDGKIQDIMYMARLCDWIDGIYHYYPTNVSDYVEKRDLAFKTIEQRIEEEASKWTMDTIREAWGAKVKVLTRKRVWGSRQAA